MKKSKISIIYLSKISLDVDQTLGFVNISFFNDGIHDSIANATLKSFVVIHGMTLNVAIKSPESVNDVNYQRMFLQTSLTVEKHLQGVRSNFIIGYLLDRIVKNIDFELKFPMQKV